MATNKGKRKAAATLRDVATKAQFHWCNEYSWLHARRGYVRRVFGSEDSAQTWALHQSALFRDDAPTGLLMSGDAQ